MNSSIPTKSHSEVANESSLNEDSEKNASHNEALTLPSLVVSSGTLDRLVGTARDYARAAASDNTLKAYAKDWAHFARWCRKKGTEPLPPSPEMIGLYLADLAAGSHSSPALSVSTIERRLSGLGWTYAAWLHPGSQEPSHCHRAGRDQAAACAPTRAERGHPGRRHSSHGRYPALRSARAARSSDPAFGLCRGSAPLGDRQYRRAQG